MKRIAIALLLMLSLTACDPKTTNGGSGTGNGGCTEACTQEDDTATVECLFLPSQVKDIDPTVSVDWSLGGVTQHSESKKLSTTHGVYHAWTHGWQKKGFPRISITCDESIHTGVTCSIKWYEPRKGLQVVDFVNRGFLADHGHVTCTSDHFVNEHVNKGD